MALLHTPAGELGVPAADFSLPGVDGSSYSLSSFSGSTLLLVMFVCNHCPYVKAVWDRLIALRQDFSRQDVAMVAINSNDSHAYPEDSFSNMQQLARTKNLPFPYLVDTSQSVARDYGAVCTPDFFVYDKQRTLRYRGRLDDSPKEPDRVKHQELKEALQALLDGRPLPPLQNPSMGCSIKWRIE
ncbi:MAG: thioredoxin family protein [Magnetococcales bacterium]|nr:thioredoxin family protein [Magnetococcales bacterium]MBF0434430.1 thioredoxin family protein [Magnetococcales bacterium]